MQFDGSASSDADSIDTIASYAFNFGDGGDDVVQSSPYATHTFTSAGEYDVKLVVTDSRGKLSSNTAHQVIEVHPTSPSSTALGSSSNPAAYATPVTFTATVTSPDGTPTGTVTFQDGSTVLGTGTLDSAGKTTFTNSSLAIGNHAIEATYGGDDLFQGSMSSVLTQTVTTRSTATSVSCSPNPDSVDAPARCTATAADASGAGASVPAGGVTFASSGAGAFDSASCFLDATGSCSVNWTPWAVGTGTQTISASYGGDSIHAGSTGSSALGVSPAKSGRARGTGKFAVPGGTSNFGFDVARKVTGGAISGQLHYQNGARNLYVRGTSFSHFNASGNTATFSGNCTANDSPCTYSAVVTDNGGNGDTFSISVSGEPTEGGTLTQGRIQVTP
ncbi:MAG: Ig-like domain repeat protein [Myxococcales bacterium]